MTPEPNRPDEREAADVLAALVAACEAEFCGPGTEEHEPDDAKVAFPEDRCHITFGHIRRARKALASLRRDAPREGASVDFEEAWRSRSANDPTERENAYAWFRAGYRNTPDRAPREGGEAVLPEGTFGWAADRNSVYYTAAQLTAYAEAALAAANLAGGDGEWRKVADSLPEFEKPVWLFDAATGSIWIGGRGDGDDGWLWCNAYNNIWRSSHDDKWESDLESDDDYQPTHWRPLPEPPA